MPVRKTVAQIVLVVAALVAVLGVPAATASHAAFPGVPTIYVQYNPDCTFSMTADGGFTFTSSSPPGPTLPPGIYQIAVLMENPASGYSCGEPDFTLTGPGVSSDTPFPDQSILDNHLLPALQPSSTYVAQDRNASAATHVYFSTSATGSSGSLIGTAPGSGAGTGKGSQAGDYVGSGILPYRGKLTAAVSPAGTAALRLHGQSIATLEPGRYDIAVADTSTRAGFFVERPGGKPVALTGVRFKGSQTRRLALTKGTWTFFATAARPIKVAVHT
jgi:hypothetical protein